MEVELDCTSSCKLVKHGNEITRVLTKHEIDEEKLIKYLICKCKNFSTSKDLNVSRKMLLIAFNLNVIIKFHNIVKNIYI